MKIKILDSDRMHVGLDWILTEIGLAIHVPTHTHTRDRAVKFK